METIDFHSYLVFLRELTQTLTRLTEVQNKKISAVRQDDLQLLHNCMKNEQALSLKLRGYDEKRQTMLRALHLEGTQLRNLPSKAPDELRFEAKEVAEQLLRQYQLLQSSSEVARNTLECNLHQIDKKLKELSANKEPVLGYQNQSPELPKNMRTDFRA